MDAMLFALHGSEDWGGEVAGALGLPLARHEEREFEDGEHKARPLENVRGRDVFVIHRLHADARASVNDKLCRMLFFIGALRDASAGRITAVVPYLPYARKDRKSQDRDPVTTRYVAALFEAVGVDRVLTMDVHNLAAFQNAFRCRTDHLDGLAVLAPRLLALAREGPVTVVAPDAGAVARAERLRRRVQGQAEIELAFAEKHRAAGIVSGQLFAGHVEGRCAVILDDLVSTGGTLARTATACRERGAMSIHAMATHGLFTGDASTVLAAAELGSLTVTDTVPAFRLTAGAVRDRLAVVPTAHLFAQAIARIHAGGSIVELLAIV